MGLRWNPDQVAIYNLIQAGSTNNELKQQGYNVALVKKVKAAINKGDAPEAPPEKEKAKEPGVGKPLFTATLKTKPMTLDPMIAVRFDSVRHALGLDDGYTLEQFIDESTDIIADLVGAVPPGFTKDEEPLDEKEPVAAGTGGAQ